MICDAGIAMHVEAAHYEGPVSVVESPDWSAARWAAETLQVMDDLDSGR